MYHRKPFMIRACDLGTRCGEKPIRIANNLPRIWISNFFFFFTSFTWRRKDEKRLQNEVRGNYKKDTARRSTLVYPVWYTSVPTAHRYNRCLCDRRRTNRSTTSTKYVMPVVLYGCETWSLTLREEHRMRVFDNRVLRRIIGPKRDEAARERGKNYMVRSLTI